MDQHLVLKTEQNIIKLQTVESRLHNEVPQNIGCDEMEEDLQILGELGPQTLSNEVNHKSQSQLIVKANKLQEACKNLNNLRQQVLEKIELDLRNTELAILKIIKPFQEDLTQLCQAKAAGQRRERNQLKSKISEYEEKQIPHLDQIEQYIDSKIQLLQQIKELDFIFEAPSIKLTIQPVQYQVIQQVQYESLVNQIENDILVMKCAASPQCDVLQLNLDDKKKVFYSVILTRIPQVPHKVFKLDDLLIIDNVCISLKTLQRIQILQRIPKSVIQLSPSQIFFSYRGLKIETFKKQQSGLVSMRKGSFTQRNQHTDKKIIIFLRNHFYQKAQMLAGYDFLIGLTCTKKLYKVQIKPQLLLYDMKKDILMKNCKQASIISERILIATQVLPIITIINYLTGEKLQQLDFNHSAFEFHVPNGFDEQIMPVLIVGKQFQQRKKEILDIYNRGYFGEVQTFSTYFDSRFTQIGTLVSKENEEDEKTKHFTIFLSTEGSLQLISYDVN